MLREKMRWTFYADLLEDELRQCAQEGRAAAALRGEVERVLALPDGQAREDEARALLLQLEAAPLRADFPYQEPESIEEIWSLLSPGADRVWPVDREALADRVSGAWYGRAVGCVLGIPVEGWPRQKIADYLSATGQLPLTDYIRASGNPELRARFEIHEDDPTTPYDRVQVCWRDCLTGFPNDDDLNYTVSALKTLERYGPGFTSDDVAETWLLGFPAFHACTAERAALRNLMQGILPPQSGQRCNPYREWIGAQIRADFFGYIRPGAPRAAAELAYRDAVVSHTKNGVYGEMFVAALLSLCAVDGLSMPQRVEYAMEQIPPRSRLHEALAEVAAAYERGGRFDEVVNLVHARYDENLQFDWCHTLPNAVLVTACVLWHNNFDEAVAAAVLAGFDTDCNGATVGSVLGLCGGLSALDAHWHDCFPPVVNTSIHGYHTLLFPELAARTASSRPISHKVRRTGPRSAFAERGPVRLVFTIPPPEDAPPHSGCRNSAAPDGESRRRAQGGRESR